MTSTISKSSHITGIASAAIFGGVIVLLRLQQAVMAAPQAFPTAIPILHAKCCRMPSRIFPKPLWD